MPHSPYTVLVAYWHMMPGTYVSVPPAWKPKGLSSQTLAHPAGGPGQEGARCQVPGAQVGSMLAVSTACELASPVPLAPPTLTSHPAGRSANSFNLQRRAWPEPEPCHELCLHPSPASAIHCPSASEAHASEAHNLTARVAGTQASPALSLAHDPVAVNLYGLRMYSDAGSSYVPKLTVLAFPAFRSKSLGLHTTYMG